ncbi:MAG: DMT family transporter [Rhodanobacter sp.]
MNTTARLDARTLTAIAIALLTWSSAYASIAYALASFTPGEVAFARLAMGSVCFAGLMLIRRAPLPVRRDWLRLAVLGVVGLSTYHLCLNYAETRIASGTASILIALTPAATAAVSAIWLRERLSARMLTGLGVALVGVMLVVLASGKQVTFQPMAALVLVCVLVTAVFFVGQKPLFDRNGMLGVTAFTFFAGTLGALPFAGGIGSALRLAPWSHIAALGYLGMGPTFVGYLAWNIALRKVSASQLASFLYFSPPIAVLIGWLWLHEQPHAVTLVGGVITVAGVALANGRRRALPSPPPVATCEHH